LKPEIKTIFGLGLIVFVLMYHARMVLMNLRYFSILILVFVLIACSNTPVTSENPLIDVTGRWFMTIRKSTGETNTAEAALTQATGDSSFKGFLRFTSITTSNGSLAGDVKTGAFKISEIGGTVYSNVKGTFTTNSYIGSYIAYYADGSTPSGTIYMTKAPPTAQLTFTVNGLANEYGNISISDGQKIVYTGLAINGLIVELPKTKLTIEAKDTEAFLAPAPQVVDLSTGDKAITLNYRQRPLLVSMLDRTLELYRKGQAIVKVGVVPAKDFQGIVEIRLQNLPPGVQQVSAKNIVVNGQYTTADVPITSATDTKFANTEVMVTATSGANSSSTKFTLQTRPELIVPAPACCRYTWLFAPDGNPYVISPSEKAVFRINPDGSREPIVEGNFSWANTLRPGSDGSLWILDSVDFGPTRIDPVAKTTETFERFYPQEIYSTAIVDAKKRVWDGHFGLKRTDLITGKTVEIPEARGKNFAQRHQIVGETYWGVYDTTVISVNTDTLAAKTYSIPGMSSVYNIFIQGKTIALTGVSKTASLGDYGLYTFDTETETLISHPIQNLPRIQVMGQDSNGILWLSDWTKWLRYDPKSKNVLQEMPTLSSTTTHVTLNGDLWYITEKGFFFVPR
jgi:hypothetical protein